MCATQTPECEVGHTSAGTNVACRRACLIMVAILTHTTLQVSTRDQGAALTTSGLWAPCLCCYPFATNRQLSGSHPPAFSKHPHMLRYAHVAP